MTDDAPVTAAGEWEEAKHPRGEHGHFRKLDEIMGDLTQATGGYGGSGKVGQARNAIREGKRAQARTILSDIAEGQNDPQVKALASEAVDRLKPVKVGKGREVSNSDVPSKPDVIHDVTHPDHGHIGTIRKATRSHGEMSGRIQVGSTHTTRYRANPEGTPGTTRSGTAGTVKEFRTRAEAEHHLAETADAKAIAAQGAAGDSGNQPQTPATPAAKAQAMISEARNAASGLKGRRKMTAGPGYNPTEHAHERLDEAQKALDAGDHRTAATKMAHAANVFDTSGDSETAQRLRNARSELRGSPAIPADEPKIPEAPRGDTPHGNTPGSPYGPAGNSRPDVAVIPEGQLVPDHVNSNFKGSLFDRQGNRFYRAQSGDVMADRPHDGEAPNSGVRKLEHATPEEQAAFERASGGTPDSSMGGGPGNPAWDRIMPSEVQPGDTISHPASNRPIKVTSTVHGPTGVNVAYDDNGTERNVLLPHHTAVPRTLPGQAPTAAPDDPRAAADASIQARRAKTAAIIKDAIDKYVQTGDAKHLETVDRAREAEQQGYLRDLRAYGAPDNGVGRMERDAAAAVPEVSRGKEIAGERRDVAATNAESIAGDNLPKGYGIHKIGINAGPDNPEGDPAYMPVHNADGAIGPATPDREVAKQAIRDHAAGRMRNGADALRKAEETGHIGDADPAGLAKRRSDTELRRIATNMPNTTEGRAAQRELDDRHRAPVAKDPADAIDSGHSHPKGAGHVSHRHEGGALAHEHANNGMGPRKGGQSQAPAAPAPGGTTSPAGTSRRAAANKPVGSIVHVRQPGGTQRLGTVTGVDGQHRHVELNPIGGGTNKEKVRVHASQITPVENGAAPGRPVASPSGRSAKMQRAFQAASEGDHAWLASHGFNASRGGKIQVKDDTGHIAIHQPDGSVSIHKVNGNGQASGHTVAQPGNTSFMQDGYRTVHEPRTGGTAMPTGSAPDGGVRGTQSDNPGAKAMTERILANRAAQGAPAASPAAGLDKYGVPADKTNQQLGTQMPSLPADHRQIADDLKAKYMLTGPEHDRGISDDLRRYYLLNNQGGRDDEAAFWLRSAEEQAARKAPGAEANREGGLTTAYEPVTPRTVNGSDLKTGDIFKVTKKRYLNTGGEATVDNPDQLYRTVEGGGYSNNGDPSYVPIDESGNPTGRPVKMMGLYTTAQVVGKDRASGPKGLSPAGGATRAAQPGGGLVYTAAEKRAAKAASQQRVEDRERREAAMSWPEYRDYLQSPQSPGIFNPNDPADERDWKQYHEALQRRFGTDPKA